MGRRYGYGRGRYRGHSYSRGHEEARRHIEEARRLSLELGGTDKDVKEYLFSLSPSKLNRVLDEYGRKYGQAKREYAEGTLPKWKDGRVQMSGLVAGRLFEFLPKFMPRTTKFALVKSLWEQKCPYSSQAFYVGPDASDGDIVKIAGEYLKESVQRYSIPESISNRFKWLAERDVDLQQELHNYFLKLNRDLVIEATERRIPMLLNQIRENGHDTKRIDQTVKIGNHSLRLVLDPSYEGISKTEPVGRKTYGLRDFEGESSDFEWGPIVWVGIVIVVIWFLFG